MAEYAEMLWREQAVERVLDLRADALATVDVETVPPSQVEGRVLAEPVVAEADRPPADVATMDGFAFDATDAYPLDVQSTGVYPEDDPPGLADGAAVRIATGAPLPERANAVLTVEEATVEDGQLRGPDLEPGTDTYRRGSNVAAGEGLFDAGERLSPKDAVLLVDLGVDAVPVRERLSVGLLATGTEIHEGRSADLDSPMLAGLVRSWGGVPTHEGSVPDEYTRVEDRVAELAADHDVVVTTGGTSVGDRDYAVRALAALGSVSFHRVRLRPGKPVAAARLPHHDAVAVAIPGKPVGAHTVAALVMRPLFVDDASLPTVAAEFPVDLDTGPEGFEYAVPVTLDGGDEGDAVPTATPLGHVDSPLSVYGDVFDPSVLSSATRTTRADGLVLTEDALGAGETVQVVPYASLE
jgi:molybdopterin molybdotransferase